MKPLILIAMTMGIVLFDACSGDKKSENPFFAEYNTPFNVPPFDRIDTTDYIPAYIEGIKKHNEEIDAIVNDSREPDFENTILAFDKSGLLLTNVSKVFDNLNEANTNPQMQEIARKIDPMMSKHTDDIFLNEKLFQRIKAVYDRRHEMNLDSQQVRVVEKYYRDFERRGANLSPDQKEQLRKINAELSMLSLTFGENILAETNKNFQLVIDNTKDLEGLPQGVIDGAAETD